MQSGKLIVNFTSFKLNQEPCPFLSVTNASLQTRDTVREFSCSDIA